mmetsp:Transcript_29796/g.65142  ORF Transcript_29796/g.65142 Transcript_29796/m.65142 type:complete len:298 (-) Transcript_29796:152-1045(-)
MWAVELARNSKRFVSIVMLLEISAFFPMELRSSRSSTGLLRARVHTRSSLCNFDEVFGLHNQLQGQLASTSVASRTQITTLCLNELEQPRLNRRQRREHLQPPGSPKPPPSSPATVLQPATLDGVTEDHAYEQFFFDQPTRLQLLRIMRSYTNPLLLCVPSLAVEAEKAGIPYRLLDRDTRFSFLPGFQEFDLAQPCALDFSYDAVFCDPPFANFDLHQLRKTLATISGSSEQNRAAALYIAYNSRREAKLYNAFSEWRLRRVLSLGYCSVKSKTQRHIHLYGPADCTLSMVVSAPF